MYHLTGNPLFPYFNEYWQSPLALAAPYRDLRFVPDPFLAAQLFFPILFTMDWHVADDLGFQDIRVCLAYLLVIARRRSSGCCGARAAIRCWRSAPPPSCSPSPPPAYFVWLQIFAIYRYIILLRDAGAAADHRRRWACCRCRGAAAI